MIKHLGEASTRATLLGLPGFDSFRFVNADMGEENPLASNFSATIDSDLLVVKFRSDHMPKRRADCREFVTKEGDFRFVDDGLVDPCRGAEQRRVKFDHLVRRAQYHLRCLGLLGVEREQGRKRPK